MPAAAVDNNTAKVYGGVYSSDTFEPLDNAVVEIDSTPSQSMVAKSGIYSFELDPGNYSITAKYYQNSTLTYSATEAIIITKGGSYRLDLLLLPVYSEELMEGLTLNLSSENSSSGNPVILVPINNTNVSNSVKVRETGINSSALSYLLLIFVLFILIAVGYNLYKKHNEIPKKEPLKEEIDNRIGASSGAGNLPELGVKTQEKVIDPELRRDHNANIEEALSVTESVEFESSVQEKPTPTKNKEEYEEESPVQQDEIEESESEEEKNNYSIDPADNSEIEISDVKKNLPLPADLQEIMDIIRGHGGRITQKDLRSRLKYSEGKVSLMLADLERRNLIEKFKRGRGNIVILKDEAR
jgi:uncharacterized membrane protein